jgi:hypothetical protein
MNAPNAELLLAQQWLARLADQAGGQAMGPAELALPPRWIDAAAALAALALAEDKQIQIVVPDDDTLPELSNALDIDLRPLCLVLPEADFATRIALRATLTLLKSRLSRHADTNPVWEAQRRRIERLSGTWQAALAWGQSETEADWPADIATLFPARLLPASHAADFAVPADLQLLIAPERMAADKRDALVHLAPRVLCLSAQGRGAEHRQLVVFNSEQRQRYELEVLTREIAELELELATVQAEIADFSQRYHAAVGKLMVELDGLQARIAAFEAARQPEDSGLKRAAEQSQAQAERSQQEQQRFEEAPNNAKSHGAQAAEPRPFSPSRDLKKLYRQIAQKIHPDRASNEVDRDWRTHLMSEATRAYRNEDEVALREVLTLWQEGPAEGASVASGQNALETQLQRMKARLASIQSELDRLLASRLYELFVAARLAQRQGRDLLQEMAVTIALQIDAARQSLQALESTTPSTEVAT